LAAWLRVINAVVFGVALVSLFKISILLDSVGTMTSSLQDDVMASLDRFNFVWLIGLVFFGFHLFILGRLMYRSGYFPKVIGALLVVAAIGYLIDSGAQLLMSNYDAHKDIFEMIVVIPSVVGEFSLTVWLLVKGVKG
jgi:hypothetical protein